ncbi:hypothetical protein [Elizabethkingia ursingii]|uniref:Uncharacterized protein n=1 Tax=Elizabethkingia ursingii TaxID=1756150 RepID=A0AAJ3TMS7_9FLAO|nr:hypothetical protein [Elizabethkingia ursingii]AQX08240.1 hypothetical protein BBD34_06080 [Elizabethkingia ursingii]OPB73404.1 hypothetical protein BAY32_10140 [Elizabethkingia ursingii]OPC00369.1 hypothetical protein BAS09_16935 [Elizabethkingia ursingii]
MNNIRINVISRIASDKNFFLDLLYAVDFLRREKKIDIKLNFIGAVYNYIIFDTLKRFTMVSGIEDLVSFTERSIPISEINKSDNDYYLNFSIGDFIGYSGIEATKKGFKTLFYNVDFEYNKKQYDSIVFLSGYKEFIEVLILLNEDKNKIDELIRLENKELVDQIFLDKETEIKLLSLI